MLICNVLDTTDNSTLGTEGERDGRVSRRRERGREGRDREWEIREGWNERDGGGRE